MNLKKTLLVVPLLFPFLKNPIWAGAWTREAGEFYGKLGISRARATQIFEAKNNKKAAGPDFEEVSLSVYGEYGITSKWTGVTNLTYKSLESETGGMSRTEAGPADAWFFIKRALKARPLVLSAQLGVKLPLGYDENTVPPLGQGQVDWEGKLLAGKGFQKTYVSGEFGYRLRNGIYSDELPFRLEGGWWLSKTLLASLALDGIDNRSNDDASRASNRPENVFDQRYTKLAPSLTYLFKNGFSAQLGYEQVVQGGNTAATKAVLLGLSWQGHLRPQNK